MGSLAAPRVIPWRVAVRLGRVSNLPTVWSNVVAGTTLAGGAEPLVLLSLGLAMSLLYVAGMYLNDAFDREIDARERGSRPIPLGEVSSATVFAAGFAMLGAGVALLALLDAAAGLVGLILAATIVLYDWHHKDNPLSPILMGVCRSLVYIGAGAALSAAFDTPVLVGALIMLFYVAGLTLAAKQGLPHIGLLIAGIAIVDAAATASMGAPTMAGICVGLFFLTLSAQRYVPGT